MAVPEHPSWLLPGEGSKHHLVSLPGCGKPRELTAERQRVPA